MKKVLLLTLLMLTAGIALNAQYRFGVKAGASVSGMALDELDTRFGFNGGVLGQYKFRNSNFAMQTEVLFNLQGAKFDYPMLGKGKYDLTYITVPVMGQYYIIPGLNVEIGPQFGFMTSAKFNPDNIDSEDVKDQMKKFDFAVNFGAAYELSMIPVGVYARYSLGITDIVDDVPSDVDAGKNRVFQFGVFVKF